MSTAGGGGKAKLKMGVIRATDSTQREQFLAMLWNSPMLQSDAAVVLCGEDASPRIQAAGAYVRTVGCSKVLLSGANDSPPRLLGARRLKGFMMGEGVAPSAIMTEEASQNTREQAVNVAHIAVEEGWASITLVPSTYHAPRAFLTFLKAFKEAGIEASTRILCVPARQVGWASCPAGMSQTRMSLFDRELGKIVEHKDHVCSYVEGIEYLASWEYGDDA